MKKFIIAIMFMVGLISHVQGEIKIEGDNVTVSTTETIVTTNTTVISSLIIEDLTYKFDSDFIRVTLRYEDEGEVVARGWAVIIPADVDNYKVTYYHSMLNNPVSLVVPKEPIDNAGLQDGLSVIQQLAYALGGLLAQMTAAPTL